MNNPNDNLIAAAERHSKELQKTSDTIAAQAIEIQSLRNSFHIATNALVNIYRVVHNTPNMTAEAKVEYIKQLSDPEIPYTLNL